MTEYNWNYEALGFNSETEMRESIARVTEQMNNPKTEIEAGVDRRAQLQAELKANNNVLDTVKLREDARLSNLDIVVHNQILHEQEQAKLQAEQAEMQDLMSGLAEQIQTDNKVDAETEFNKRKEKADAELQKEIYDKHGVKTDKEQAIDDAFNNMLKD